MVNELDPRTAYLVANTDKEYFAALNPSEVYLSKLNALKQQLPKADVIASLGMAGGEDICTLAQLYGDETKLVGIDISPVALEIARNTTRTAGVKAEFMESNATSLDIPNWSIDEIVLSAVMHEVYSYADDGKDAFTKAIGEVYKKISPGGCIFISDFAAPRLEGRVGILPKTPEAAQFIDYFVHSFRKFNDIEQSGENDLVINTSIDSPSSDDSLQSTPAFVSEVLWHFKHYKKKFQSELTPNTYPQGWKEINEAYLPLDPRSSDDIPMPIDNYISAVIAIAKDSETAHDTSLECTSATLTPQKPATIDMLDEHFTVITDDNDMPPRDLIIECTNWMDVVFKKVFDN